MLVKYTVKEDVLLLRLSNNWVCNVYNSVLGVHLSLIVYLYVHKSSRTSPTADDFLIFRIRITKVFEFPTMELKNLSPVNLRPVMFSKTKRKPIISRLPSVGGQFFSLTADNLKMFRIRLFCQLL